MSDLSLNVAINNSGKEYAVRKPTPQPQQEAQALSQGIRESGFEWTRSEKNDLNLTTRISDVEALLTTTATDTSAKIARTGLTSQEMLQDLKSRFKKMFITAYSGAFSHNRLMAKVSEWMVGNVMERLALMGMELSELDELKGQVRGDLIGQNRSSMEQVIYDETMLEIVG